MYYSRATVPQQFVCSRATLFTDHPSHYSCCSFFGFPSKTESLQFIYFFFFYLFKGPFFHNIDGALVTNSKKIAKNKTKNEINAQTLNFVN